MTEDELVRRLLRDAFVINAKQGYAKREMRWDEVLRVIVRATDAHKASK